MRKTLIYYKDIELETENKKGKIKKEGVKGKENGRVKLERAPGGEGRDWEGKRVFVYIIK